MSQATTRRNRGMRPDPDLDQVSQKLLPLPPPSSSIITPLTHSICNPSAMPKCPEAYSNQGSYQCHQMTVRDECERQLQRKILSLRNRFSKGRQPGKICKLHLDSNVKWRTLGYHGFMNHTYSFHYFSHYYSKILHKSSLQMGRAILAHS